MGMLEIADKPIVDSPVVDRIVAVELERIGAIVDVKL